MALRNDPGAAVFRRKLRKHPEGGNADDSGRKRLCDVPLLVQIVREIGVICTDQFVVRGTDLIFGLRNTHLWSQ